jgi:ABC-type uncharacterized transport system auxiliary subunit
MKMPAILSAVALSLSLGACVSVLPDPVVPSALISLPADRAKAPSAPLQADVNVFPPDSSRAFSGVDIAVRSGQELVYLPEVRWADTAPKLLQGAVVDALTKAEGPGNAMSAQQGARVDYDVRWRVIDLSVGKDTLPVTVEVDASLVDAQTRKVIAQRRFSAQGSPASKAPRERAAVLAVAMQSVADQVAAFVTETAVPKAAVGTPAN